MIDVLVFVLMFVNLFIALSVFVLIVRPEKIMGFLAYLGSRRQDWESGNLDEMAEYRLFMLARRLQIFGLLLLFLFSFVSGALISYIQLLKL